MAKPSQSLDGHGLSAKNVANAKLPFGQGGLKRASTKIAANVHSSTSCIINLEEKTTTQCPLAATEPSRS